MTKEIKPKVYTVQSVSNLDLYLIECPHHGVVPIGFFHQIPKQFSKDKKTVEITLGCNRCDYDEKRVYKIKEK